MRFIGMDVHRDSCDVAIYEDGEVRSVYARPTSCRVRSLWSTARSRATPSAVRRSGR